MNRSPNKKQIEDALARITTSVDLAAQNAQLVVEAATENVDCNSKSLKNFRPKHQKQQYFVPIHPPYQSLQ